MIAFDLIAMSAALASASPDPQPRTVPAAVPTQALAPTIKTDVRHYCVVDTITGSRIPMRVCRSRAEWLYLGFDPLVAK